MTIHRILAARFRKTAAMLLAVLAVLLLSATLAATPANAATCYRQSCNYQNPSTTGCSSASTGTIDSMVLHGVYIELRLSGTCSAAWTRSTYSGCDNNAAGNIYTEAFYDYQGTQWAGTTSQSISCNGIATYTDMLSFYFYVRACIHLYSGERYCTALH